MTTTSQDPDFMNAAVPASARLSILQALAVWMGFVVVVGTMATGGALSRELPFWTFVCLVLASNAMLGLMGAVTGCVGAKTGKSFSLLVEETFPGRFATVVNMYVPLVLIFWFSVVSCLAGDFAGKLFGLSEEFIWVSPLAACLIFTTTAYFGMRALASLSLILVPIIIVLGSWVVFRNPLPEYVSGSDLSNWGDLNRITGLILSTWVMGAVLNLYDITRFCRTPAAGAFVGFMGVFLGNSFNIIIGARAALVSGAYDPTSILVSLGFTFLGAILIISNLWTTNDNNMYSASLGAARVFGIPRRAAVVGCASIAAALTFLRPGELETIINGFVIMGATAPALGGVVLARQLIGSLPPATQQLEGWIGLGSWIFGTIVAFYLSGATGIMLSFVLAAGIYGIMLRAFMKRSHIAHDI